MIRKFYEITTTHLSLELIQRKSLRVYASNKGAIADSYMLKYIRTFVPGRPGEPHV